MTKKKEDVPEVVIYGFKGFDKDMKCRGFQFEVGKEYTEEDAVICQQGFHFCENPLHILRYYVPTTSRFAIVEGSGKTVKHDQDSKVVCTHIKIGAELSFKGFIEAAMKFTFDKIKWGEKDKAQTHGDSSAAQTHGYYSAAAVSGKESIAVSTGYQGKAKGIRGCWLVLTEWNDSGDKIKLVETVKVDGVNIKEDTFYRLIGGEFKECA